jgi:hypothetical protein
MRQLFSFFYWRWKKSGHHYPFFIILEKIVFALNTCAGRWFQVSWSLCRAMLSDREVHKFCMNVVYVPVSHTKISSGCTIADTITQFFCCPRTFRPILKPQQPGRRFRTPGRRGSPDAKEPRLCVGGRGDCRPAVWGAWWPRLGHPPCRCPRRIALPRSGGRKQPIDRLAYQPPRRIALPRNGRGESTVLIAWLISHQPAILFS